MVLALVIQFARCLKRKFCLSDEDYIREYFSELELSERLNLTTPVMNGSSQVQQSHHAHSSLHMQHPSGSLEGKQSLQQHMNDGSAIQSSILVENNGQNNATTHRSTHYMSISQTSSLKQPYYLNSQARQQRSTNSSLRDSADFQISVTRGGPSLRINE